MKLFEHEVHSGYVLTFYVDGTYKYSTYSSDEISWWRICEKTEKLQFNHRESGGWHDWPIDNRVDPVNPQRIKDLIFQFIFENEISRETAE